MKKVELGKTGVLVSPISFGAWAIGGWMWGGADRRDATDAIHASMENGVTTIDTAPIYGFGLSEEIVGKAIEGKRSAVEILTKYGMSWKGTKGQYYFDSVDNNGTPVKIYRYSSKESVIAECEASLRRLKTDHIDLYQIHWPDLTTPVEETMEAIDLLLQQGKIRAAGVCNYDVELLKKAKSCVPLASNQVPYSMVRRDIEQDVVPWCLENQVSILAYSPLQRGLLTGKIKPDHKFGKGDNRPNTVHFLPENIARVNELLHEISSLANDLHVTIGQLVVAWTLKQPGITVALVGARNRQQAVENAGTLQLDISWEMVDWLNSKLGLLELKS